MISSCSFSYFLPDFKPIKFTVSPSHRLTHAVPRIVAPTDEMIAEAARRLRAGGVVAFATETVYGLGADSLNPAAIEKIYALKGRPFNNPLIAHVLDWKQAKQIVNLGQAIQNDAPSKNENREFMMDAMSVESLISKFWPGPLTLILPKASSVPARSTAGLNTLAVRSPAHPAARNLLKAFGGPISAPSANRSGHVSPTTAQHVAADFAAAQSQDAADLLILDGGPCEVGLESTVLDMTSDPPRVLRPGAVTIEQLREILGEVETPNIRMQAESPGTSAQHYAPRTPAELVRSSDLRQKLSGASQSLAVLTLHPEVVNPPHRAIAMPSLPEEYARRIYSALREADAMNCAKIIIEEPPEENDMWRAIHDRVRRATAPS